MLYAEIRTLEDSTTIRRLGISDGTSNNRVLLGTTNNNKQVYATVRSGAVDQADLRTTIPTTTDYFKIACVYSVNDVKFYLNGLLINVDTLATMPIGMNELAFDDGAGTTPFYGRVKRLSVYDSALSDSELEALTGFGSFSEMASYLSYS